MPGTFNATNPGIRWGELLETCRAARVRDAEIVWVSDEFLREQKVGEWMELPLWIADPDWVGMHLADVSRALEAGLSFRPLAETIRATLDEAEPVEGVGLSSEREIELLQAWHAR